MIARLFEICCRRLWRLSLLSREVGAIIVPVGPGQSGWQSAAQRHGKDGPVPVRLMVHTDDVPNDPHEVDGVCDRVRVGAWQCKGALG
jgi:hypothetical protein